jgi:hypothetical protein
MLSFAGIGRSAAKAAAMAATAAAIASAPSSAVHAASPFAQLGGSWSGGGQVRFTDGGSERIRCRAYYNPKAGGSELSLALRCASTGFKIELRASLRDSNGRVTGSWEERTYNASGNVVGRASSGNLSLAISGPVSGTLGVAFGASHQRVSIRTSGTGFSSASISLSR